MRRKKLVLLFDFSAHKKGRDKNKTMKTAFVLNVVLMLAVVSASLVSNTKVSH